MKIVYLDLDLSGLFCLNEEQPSGTCSDFSVSFCCPPKVTEEDWLTCDDENVCGANEWCLECPEGIVCKCGDDDFNDDPDKRDFIHFEDGTCLSIAPPETITDGKLEKITHES